MSLIEAARSGSFQEVQRLLAQGTPGPSYAQRDQALIGAALNDHLPMVEFLLDHGADIHAGDDLALIYASRNGRFPVVEFLVNRGADIHAQNDQALIECSCEWEIFQLSNS